MCELIEGCGCAEAVTRTYRELKNRAYPEPAAFEAAATVFAYHHPDSTARRVRDVVAEWLDPAP